MRRARAAGSKELNRALGVLLGPGFPHRAPQTTTAGQPEPQTANVVSEATNSAERPSQTRWDLWFQAKPLISPALLGRTKTGKVRRQPTRYPPNINERRAMHWTVERRTVEYWRSYAAREVKRHGTLGHLDRVRISARVYRRALGVADASGDSERIKPLVDGLVDAGVVSNDTRRYVEYGPVVERRTSTHHRGDGILLTVEALDPAAASTPGEGGV